MNDKELKEIMMVVIVIYLMGFLTCYAFMTVFILGSILLILEAGILYFLFYILKDEYSKDDTDDRES